MAPTEQVVFMVHHAGMMGLVGYYDFKRYIYIDMPSILNLLSAKFTARIMNFEAKGVVQPRLFSSRE